MNTIELNIYSPLCWYLCVADILFSINYIYILYVVCTPGIIILILTLQFISVTSLITLSPDLATFHCPWALSFPRTPQISHKHIKRRHTITSFALKTKYPFCSDERAQTEAALCEGTNTKLCGIYYSVLFS